MASVTSKSRSLNLINGNDWLYRVCAYKFPAFPCFNLTSFEAGWRLTQQSITSAIHRNVISVGFRWYHANGGRKIAKKIWLSCGSVSLPTKIRSTRGVASKAASKHEKHHADFGVEYSPRLRGFPPKSPILIRGPKHNGRSTHRQPLPNL